MYHYTIHVFWFLAVALYTHFLTYTKEQFDNNKKQKIKCKDCISMYQILH